MMARIAIIHYTAPPVVGGVEQLLGAQVAALSRLGHRIRVIVGEGSALSDAETVVLPLLQPSHPDLRKTGRRGRTPFPEPDHPLVRAMTEQLLDALHDVDQCWVHNAFTVFLNPYLTVALHGLVHASRHPAWVAWCADLTDASRYWDGPKFAVALHQPEFQARVMHVAISEVRREELTRLYGIDRSYVRVIRPPLDVSELVGFAPQTEALLARIDSTGVYPLVLVPSKLLPHKQLSLAVSLAGGLREHFQRPRLLITAASSHHQGDLSHAVADSIRDMCRTADLSDVVTLLPDLLGADAARSTVRDLMLLCDFVFLPSAEEGYGMPVREAIALRVPLLCSDIAAFRESGGDAAHYFSPRSTAVELASRALLTLDTPTARMRREVVTSPARFRAQVGGLVDEVQRISQ